MRTGESGAPASSELLSMLRHLTLSRHALRQNKGGRGSLFDIKVIMLLLRRGNLFELNELCVLGKGRGQPVELFLLNKRLSN